MCRLFGLIADAPVGVQYWMQKSLHPFRSWSDPHSHGWGIGWYGANGLLVVKEPGAAKESAKFNETASMVRSRISICHLRKATCGEHISENTHPFSCGTWLFAHNGTIDVDYFRSKLTDEHRSALNGDTDSEVYFRWLLQGIERYGTEGLGRAIGEIRARDFTALNFVMSDGHSLYAYWEQALSAKPLSPDYYQLWCAERRSISGGKEVIICSEHLDDEEWTRIPHRSLMVVSENLERRVVSLS